MNVYVVTEGVVEKKVYREWIPLVNQQLVQVSDIDEVKSNNFFLVSAGGYPSYFRVINDAIDDVNNYAAFDRLVVSIDSEDMTRDEKLAEVEAFIAAKACRATVIVVVQHFCFESWALGNRLVVRPNTQSTQLKRFRRIHDVRAKDPELLPRLDEDGLTRSQFAERYLRVALNDRFRNLTYSKRNPTALLHWKYLAQLQLRLSQTGHIPSFGDFLAAFA